MPDTRVREMMSLGEIRFHPVERIIIDKDQAPAKPARLHIVAKQRLLQRAR